MRWPPKKVIMAIVVIAIILLIWSGRSLRATSTEYLFDRIWIDRVTDDPRELVDMVYLLDDGDLGLLGKSSRYRFSVDFVRWSLEGEHLSLHVLQEDERRTYEVKTWRCGPGEAPSDDFEYCMSLAGPDRTRKYFANDREDSRFTALLP
jgi:hypothetical protein